MAINEERQLGRAKNAVMSFLEQRLSIPKIYIDATWDGHHVDVLAINRDGVGDVHVVLLFTLRYSSFGNLDDGHEWKMEEELLDRFSTIHANYKYIGVVDVESNRKTSKFDLIPRISEKSFSADGLGRVGFLKVDVPLEGESRVQMEIKPERFRAKIAKLADDYIQQHEADWEIRA
jgi:hypothetical protein